MLHRLLESFRSRGRRRWLVGGAAALSLLIVWSVSEVWFGSEATARRLLREARRATWDGRHQFALQLAERALRATPHSDEAHLLAAETAVKLRQPLVALDHCGQIRPDRPETATARRIAADIQWQLARPLAAEASLRETLMMDATDRASRIKLMNLLRLAGRNRELAEHVRSLLTTGDCPAEFLSAVAWPDRIWIDAEDQAIVQRCRRESPADALIGMGLAIQSALTSESLDAAVLLLREAQAGDFVPDEVFARLGTLLVDAGRWNEFAAWDSQLPSRAETHPQVWYLRGLHALQAGQVEQALHHFCHTLEIAPQHAGAIHQLAGLLLGTSQAEAVPSLLETSRQLNELRQWVVVGKGRGGNPDAEVLEQIAARLEALGRDWEAFGWSLLGRKQPGFQRTTEERLQRLKPRLVSSYPMISNVGDVTQRLDWLAISALKPARAVTASPSHASRTDAQADCRFAEVSAELGLDFRFHQRSGAAPPLGHMFEISAGGIGVLDFDLDGWPDVYLSQGCDWPPHGQSQAAVDTPVDQLFRNVAGRAFVSVTSPCAIREADYGQGVAVGDLNNDGFPDLCVTNIGLNRLWINQGDGTFVPGTGSWGQSQKGELGRERWSMSAALADFNGDGVTDLFIVNYLGGDALTKICDRDGHPVQCRPTMFPGEQNQLFIGNGEGGFVESTRESGVVFPEGKGMGVVAADWDGSGKLSLFVSNDTTQNAFFQNVTPHREGPQAGHPPLFEERGIVAGVGFGDDGQPQASMGIAADDANRDGRLDLLVTNFTNQGSNLFLRQELGEFTDLARPWRIHDRSYHRMGWGTQFLDADLDGDPDLIVANGHLEDYSRFGITSRMSAQFFRNLSGHQFEEPPDRSLGTYFSEKTLGRTVARWDWNRDGREEALITHVDRPVALLRNDTAVVGHRLSLRLVATTTARDAIGGRVTTVNTPRTLARQLLAGDGFQCCNQRQLVLGLGDHSAPVTLQIDWPSGRRQEFGGIPVDREVLLIEGRDRAIPMAPTQP